mgnify:CR=1 FL=1
MVLLGLVDEQQLAQRLGQVGPSAALVASRMTTAAGLRLFVVSRPAMLIAPSLASTR